MEEELTPQLLSRLMTLHEVSVPLAIGRATISWNTLTGAVFTVYKLLSQLDEDAAKATFFAVASDRSQRDMVTNLAQLKAGHHPAGKKILTLLGKANGVAGKRNDILHVVFSDVLDPMAVSQLHERGHLKGKKGTDLLDAIHAFSMETMNLAIDMIAAASSLLNSGFQNRLLWPQKPTEGTLLQTAEAVANRGEFGLLDAMTTTPSPAKRVRRKTKE